MFFIRCNIPENPLHIWYWQWLIYTSLSFHTFLWEKPCILPSGFLYPNLSKVLARKWCHLKLTVWTLLLCRCVGLLWTAREMNLLEVTGFLMNTYRIIIQQSLFFFSDVIISDVLLWFCCLLNQYAKKKKYLSSTMFFLYIGIRCPL